MSRIQGNLTERALEFALVILRLVDELPNNIKGWEIGRQLLRSGTSIGANLREADCAFSDADFLHKCSVARKEAAETGFWLEVCQRGQLLVGDSVRRASSEADELLKVLSSIVKGTERHLGR